MNKIQLVIIYTLNLYIYLNYYYLFFEKYNIKQYKYIINKNVKNTSICSIYFNKNMLIKVIYL